MKWTEKELQDAQRRQAAAAARRIVIPRHPNFRTSGGDFRGLTPSELREMKNDGVPLARGRRNMTKEEAVYGDRLRLLWRAGQYGSEPRYEPITLKIGDDCRYTADWLAIPHDGPPELHEVKPPDWSYEDAMVKLRVAATMFPFFTFFLARRHGRASSWQVKRIERA